MKPGSTPTPAVDFICGTISLVAPKHVVEIGAYVGETSARLADVATRLTLIEKDAHHAALLRDNIPSATVLQCYAQAADWEALLPDFVFLDVEPKSTYRAVFDSILWAPGDNTLILHDTNYPTDPGAHGMPAYLRAQGWDVIEFPQQRGVTLARRVL